MSVWDWAACTRVERTLHRERIAITWFHEGLLKTHGYGADTPWGCYRLLGSGYKGATLIQDPPQLIELLDSSPPTLSEFRICPDIHVIQTQQVFCDTMIQIAVLPIVSSSSEILNPYPQGLKVHCDW